MGLLDLLISSLPSAPGSGFGAGTAAAGSAAAGGASAPPGCGFGGGGMGGPGTDGESSDMSGPDEASGPDEPDYTPAPEPYTPADVPMGWDQVTGGAEGASDGSAAPPAPSGSTDSGGDSFFYPSEGGRSYVTVQALDRYGDWLRDGSPGERAAKALTGLVVVPVGAILTCAENAIRSPIL